MLSLIKKKKAVVKFSAIIFLLIITSVTYFILKKAEYRKIPTSWSSYNNLYYGYSLRHGPDVVAEPIIYGPIDGEDLGVVLHAIDQEKLRANGLEKHFLDDLYRGVLIDSNYAKWNLQILKPEQDFDNKAIGQLKKTCKQNKTNGGFTYYECNNVDLPWSFTILLTSQSDSTIFLSVQLAKPYSFFSSEDKLTIKRIVNSFSQESQPSKLTYPTKNDLLQWIKLNWCSKNNKLFEEYENGLKQYSRYSVLSLNKVMDTVYLTQPKSFCEVPIDSMPFIPSSSCPFPDTTQLLDNHALGSNKQYSICGNSLPPDSVEHSGAGVASLLQTAIAQIKPISNKTTKYIIMNNEGVAITIPSNWNIQESPIGSCDSKNSCNSDFIEVRDPDMQILLTLGKEKMFTKDVATKEAVNLGSVECGAYANCELIRETSSEITRYEYYLLLTGQPNIVAIPNRIAVKFIDTQNEAMLLKETDKIVKSMIFLYEHKIND